MSLQLQIALLAIGGICLSVFILILIRRIEQLRNANNAMADSLVQIDNDLTALEAKVEKLEKRK